MSDATAPPGAATEAAVLLDPGDRAAGARLTLDEEVAGFFRRRGAPRRPTSGWATPTPTELDVVRLVADGLSNPEIGSRLFMSRGTVKTHLSHVYAKLGVANRTELATLATPHLAKVDDSRAGGSQ
jgi:DNA-binding CsgD family transcriptional regulator